MAGGAQFLASESLSRHVGTVGPLAGGQGGTQGVGRSRLSGTARTLARTNEDRVSIFFNLLGTQ